jgi:hypothetical protein
MNKCPFCKQEIKEENVQVLIKINGKPQRVVAKHNIVKGSYKDASKMKKSVYVVEVVEK